FFGGSSAPLFSCDAASSPPLGDLWRYSLRCRRWIQVSAPMGPSARTGATATHEGQTVNRSRMIIFGGRDANGQLLNDAWAYDTTPQTWTQIQTMGTPPEPRELAKLVFNASFDQVWLFGGNAGSDPRTPMLRNDVWALDLKLDKNTWTQLPVTSQV